MRVACYALLGCALIAACSEESGESSGSGGSEGGLDAASDANVSDVDPDVVNACGQCGSARFGGSCASKRSACEADPDCQAMLECVYGAQPGCPLGPTGGACVAECVRTFCTNHESVRLFYAAELCAYCDPACTAECAPYCDGFVVDAATAVCWSLEGGVDAASD
jgi:hypothetical protein